MPPVEKPWFRMYASILTDHKVQALKGDALGWLNLLAVASVRKPRGTLPDREECAFQLRMSQQLANKLIERLIAVKLVDDGPDGMRVHNWGDWQKERDVAPAKREDNHANVTLSAIDNHANVTDTVRKITLDQIRGEEEKNRTEQRQRRADPIDDVVADFAAFGATNAGTVRAIEEAIEDFSLEWVKRAVSEARGSGAEGAVPWNYCLRTLERWKIQGGPDEPRKDTRAQSRSADASEPASGAFSELDRFLAGSKA